MHARPGLGTAAAAAIVAALLASRPAQAFAPRDAAATAAAPATAHLDDEWVTTDAAGVDAPVRRAATFTADRPMRPAAWQRFAAAAPGVWFASWDRATAIPDRIYGEGLAAPGAVADPAAAEAFARRFLADHLDLLAPGARVDDFELVANVSDGSIRSVGFFQHKHGLRVVGGQIGFEFKRDRLFVIHSEALPDVQVPAFTRLASADVVAVARARTLADTGLAAATASAPGEPVILPLVGDDRVLGYRVVVPVVVDAGATGRWTVYADASSGAPIARHQELRFSAGTVQYDAVVRWPGRPRQVIGAQRMHATVDGAAQTTSAAGGISWSAAGGVSLVAGTEGDLVSVKQPMQATATFPTTIAPGGTVLWTQAATDTLDAEVNAFVHVQIANNYVRTFAPDLAWLDQQLLANVDIDDPKHCNAFYDGTSLNMLTAGNGCINTALVADVIYHEFEHGVHDHAVIAGVGQIDGSFGEGQSDFLAASITGDSGMGRGFMLTDAPLRELDPPDGEARWPDNADEIHKEGLIFAGAMWDLRKALIAQLGEPTAVPIVNKLFYAAVQRTTSIPASLVEVLAADDDDGNLANGTPHECAILTAFGAHGLRPWTATATQPGSIVAAAGQTTTPIDVALTGLSTRCTSDAIASVRLVWRPRSGSTPRGGSQAMTMGADATQWHGDLPLPDDSGIVGYQIAIAFADGSSMTLPDNNVDPYYALYQGATVPLYCTDFESDPFAAGWTHMGLAGHDDWMWGTPVATSSGDPGAAFSGTHVVGTTIGGDGFYSPSADMQLISPPIDLGKYSDVHLQYRRHLAVQDGLDDLATISANGEIAWQNPATVQSQGRQLHYVDKEWVFDDVPLSGHIAFGNQLTLSFELHSDGGYQLGGWNLDDVCVVANANAFCGDGIRQGTEQCDNGPANADLPDVCRTYCRLPQCGDGILDKNEACDDGNKLDGDACTPQCTIPPPKPDGCCQASRPPGPALVLAWLLAGAALRFRRRRPRA